MFMLDRRRTAGAAFVAAAAVGSLTLTLAPAQADFSPQPNDVVSTGSDIIQNSFNFLADGYHQLPGYNSAGNRWRFVNFDSSGDAQGRSAFTDPRLLPTITGNGTVGENGVKYVKQGDIKLLNPTISLRAGQDLVVRPSGGGGGGRDAIIADDQGWIDVGRSPDPLNATNQNNAQSNLGSKLIRVQIATDRQLIATATETNAPATISAEAILKIYSGEWTKWGDIPGYAGAGAGETIIPLLLPTDAGMWNTFVANVAKQNPGAGVVANTLRGNPNSVVVQQNDPTAITALPDAVRKNAIVPFPRGRFRTLNTGYYTQTFDGQKTNNYNTESGHRTPASAQGIKLLDGNSNADVASPSAPYGGNFAYNAIVRERDFLSTTPWQPGSTLNWVEALFYNPDGPAPFVRTPAGEALLEAAGVTPDYHVFGTDNAEIELD
jgi:ABC-type phosphate transport system substrate-binding protein